MIRQYEAHRGSSAARGYDSRWRRFAGWFKARNPVCADCQVERSTEVHHIEKIKDRPDLRLNPASCVALCGRYHDLRTARGE